MGPFGSLLRRSQALPELTLDDEQRATFDLFKDAEDAAWHQAQDEAMLDDTSTAQSFERRLQTHDGREIDLLFNKSLFVDADNNAAGIV